MGAMASQITSLTVVYSTVYSGGDQRKHQSSASLAFVRGIHRWPVNSPHKGPVTRKMFPFDDVIMALRPEQNGWHLWTFSNAFSWDKLFIFSFKCHWSLVLRVQLLKKTLTSGQAMAWRLAGDKPLPKAMLTETHVAIWSRLGVSHYMIFPEANIQHTLKNSSNWHVNQDRCEASGFFFFFFFRKWPKTGIFSYLWVQSGPKVGPWSPYPPHI